MNFTRKMQISVTVIIAVIILIVVGISEFNLNSYEPNNSYELKTESVNINTIKFLRKFPLSRKMNSEKQIPQTAVFDLSNIVDLAVDFGFIDPDVLDLDNLDFDTLMRIQDNLFSNLEKIDGFDISLLPVFDFEYIIDNIPIYDFEYITEFISPAP